MSNDTAITIDINPALRIRIEYDTDPISPQDWDNVGEIAYCSNRETLGTENVSRDRLREIDRGISDGTLIGMPVYAYVHSGVTIRTSPFSCPWDSGQSGFVYTKKENAIKEFGKKIATKAVIEKTLRCLQGEVETFDAYLRGDVYGFIIERVTRDEDDDIEDTEQLDSCWGFYGLDYCVEEAKSAASYQVEQDLKESAERLAMEQRDVCTV